MKSPLFRIGHSESLPNPISLILPLIPILGFLLQARVAESGEKPANFAPDHAKVVFDFVGKYCLECHDAATEKGDRDFEEFELPLETEPDLIAAKDIVDQVTLREMPPEEADQPSDEERLALLRSLRQGMATARDRIGSTGARTVMRRLSTREYENTLETLFGRRVDTLGLTADFPKENTSRHLDNIGDTLVMSGFLLDQHFQAANRLVELRLGEADRETRTWHFKDHFVQYEELQGPHREALDFEHLCLYEQPNTDTRQGGYGHIEDFLEGVPASGLYEIKTFAAALHRDTHYDPEIFRIDFSEPFQLAVVTGDVTKGHIHYPQAIEPVLDGPVLVPDDEPEWLTFRVWLEAGQTPRFIFPNGPYESRASVIQINKRYQDEFKTRKKGSSNVSRAHILREGALPHIRISEIKIRGPLPEKGGSKEERAVFGSGGFREDRSIEQLENFAERAFRRPLDKRDRERIRKVHQQRLSEKAIPRQAALDTVKSILCSPSFLYLSEITPEDETALRPYDLAARLSYALWSGPPDRELLDAAAEGKLSQPKILVRQVRRMLDDERAEHFVNDFLDSWLNLRDIGGMPPPRKAAWEYYARDLPSSMKGEARRFFRHLLRENGPITDFLDADYTFVDKALAQHYGLPAKDELRLADGFQKVKLDGKSHRGGVLGMAAVLTVSANGVDTSPVTRGVWVSENILGVVPPPPPDEVPEIEPDVRGTTTIRERLEKHRAQETCAECHRKIDPYGFGLETFDPVGRWRTRYPKPESAKKDQDASVIDPSGTFPSGERFAGFGEFKRILADTRQDAFLRHLISQVLAHATGRHMETADHFEIEEIAGRVAKDGYGLRTLVVEALTSEIFRSR